MKRVSLVMKTKFHLSPFQTSCNESHYIFKRIQSRIVMSYEWRHNVEYDFFMHAFTS